MNLFHFSCFGVHLSKETFCFQQKQKYLLIFIEKNRYNHVDLASIEPKLLLKKIILYLF